MTVQPPDSDLTKSCAPRTTLLTNITTQTSLLQQLFSSLSAPSTAPTTTTTAATVPNTTAPLPPAQTIPTVYNALVGCTEEMQTLCEGLWAHQAAYAEMKRKEREVRGLEERVRGLLRTLEEGRKGLEGMIMDSRGEEGEGGSEKRGSLKSIPVSTLLSHARLLAKHSSAPTSQHMPPSSKGIYKPYPTETSMRQGILFMEGGSLPGLGDIEEMVPGEVRDMPHPDGDFRMEEEIVEERRERRNVPAVFNLDLNSDSEDE